MSFKDIFKNQILNGFQTNISTIQVIVTLLFAALLGVYIFAVYRYKSKSSLYSKDFNVSLRVLPVITAAIVLSMQASIVISLGMVGALSVIRFRNAVKNSLDLTFLFWCISCGIIVGAGVYELAILASAAITVMLFLFDLVPVKNRPYLLVINGKNLDYEKDVLPLIKENAGYFKLKSKSVSGSLTDVIMEVRCENESRLVSALSRISGVENVTLLGNDGEERRGS